MSHSKTISVGLVLACASLPSVPHHSAAMFDSTRQVNYEGVVSEVAWKNPHVYITLKTATGPVTMELGPPSTLNPLGFKSDTIKTGDKVTIVGNPPRSGTLALGRELVKADGTFVPLMISSARAQRAKVIATADTVAGTWVPEGFFSFLQSRSRFPLNDKSRAVLQASTSENSTQNECIPVGAPMVMYYPTVNRIENTGSTVLLHIDWMDTERVVYMDGRKPPANAKPTANGFSTGKWEGKTLVVDTTLFAEHREGNGLGLPSGTRKHLVERFVLSEDRKSLTYEFTLEDPDWLTAPMQHSVRWDYHPEMKPSDTRCDVKAASRFIKNE
jgi:hypothetical protein